MKPLRLGLDETAPYGESATEPGRKLRRPWLALLLGILAPGLGQLYAGRPKRGTAAAILFFVVALPAATYLPVLLAWSPALTVLGWLLAVAVLVAVPADGWLVARRLSVVELTGWNRVWVYVVCIVVFRIAGIALSASMPWIVQALPWRQFSVPTGAMIPTMLTGEHFIADMRGSTVEWLQRGDIVIFEAPSEPSKLWAKRVIGLPGEIIEIRDKSVFIDGRALEEPYKVHETEYSREGWNEILQGRMIEPIPGIDRRRRQLTLELDTTFFNLIPQKIPMGEWFVMGDNRDNSKDSRAYGPIPTSAIRGLVTRINWSRASGSLSLRWHRLGMALKVPRFADAPAPDTGFH